MDPLESLPPFARPMQALQAVQEKRVATEPGVRRERLAVDAPQLSEAQARVLALVTEFPGMTIRQLTKPVGSSHATVTYHLMALARKGLLVRERDGREVRHYVSHEGRPAQYLAALSRNPTKRAILVFLANQTTTLSVNQMAQQLGMPFGFVKRTLMALDQRSLIRVEVKNFRYFVSVLPALRSHAFEG